MDHQPDKLFRDKLAAYDSPVAPHVWNRVASNVKPKRTAVWWLSAAAVALIASAAVFLYPLTKEPTQLTDSVNRPEHHDESPPGREPDINAAPSEQGIAKKENATPVQAKDNEQSSGEKRSAPKKKKQYAIEGDNLPVIALSEREPVAIATEELPPPVIKETDTRENPGRKTITIVFSAREVNEKYLSKTSSAHATSSEEEASTLKNMLDKAYDLTHNQSPLGELRQKKNEILAMNFKKDKPRTQND